MVSLLEVQRQREKEQRAERLRQARQVGSELGKMGARRYSEAKKEQEAKVTSRLRERWEQEQQSQLQASDQTSFEIERRRGEGMRNAAAFNERRYQEALKENDAWKSEKHLEAQRMSVGLASDRLQREEERLKVEEAKARRAFAKNAEDERSRRVVLQNHKQQQNRANVSNSLLGSGKGLLSPGGRGAAVTLHTKDEAKETAEKEAQKVAEKRQREMAQKQTSLSKRQEETKQRAIKAIEEERLAQEKVRLEEEQEAAFKAKMIEENFRNRGHHTVVVDYQEQEARKATGLHRRAHLEFEETFLQLQAWKDVMAHHKPPEESGMIWDPSGEEEEEPSAVPSAWWDDESPAAAAQSDSSPPAKGHALTSIRLKAVPLQVTPFDAQQQQAPPAVEGDGAAEDVAVPSDQPQRVSEVEPEEEQPAPERPASIPMPQPKLSHNPDLMRQVEDILFAAGVDAGDFPSVSGGGELDQEEAVGEAPEGEGVDEVSEDTDDEFERVTSQQRLGLREQHEKYLGDLHQLRERIAASASGRLQPAATYVDPTLLPPLAPGDQTIPIAATSGQVPSTYQQDLQKGVVRVNPRYQLVAQQVRSQYEEEAVDNRGGIDDQADTTLSPMSTPDKGTSPTQPRRHGAVV